MELILSILAGVGLFLYGMNLMSDGLQKVAGQKMRDVLEKLTKSSIMGLLLGIIFTGIIQSSNATTVLVVSFVNSGIMKLSQSVGVIMGANIGTTVTGQLISFKLDAIAPFFIIAGVILVMFIKKPMAKRIGEVVLGFGILFFGMSTLSSSVKHLNQFAAVKTLFGSVTHLDAKRAALIHLSFNMIGTVIVMILLAVAGNPIRSAIHGLTASIADTGLRAGRDVANINSILKVSQVIILFPFSKYLIKLTRWLVKGEDEDVHGLELKYIGNHSIFNVTTALPQAIHETERMGTMAVNNLKRSMKALMEKDEEALEEVYKKEEVIDFLNTEISNYLVRANQLSLPIQDRKELGAMFHVVNDIERIGDHAENIADFAKTMRKADLQFSKKATNELMELYEKVCTLLEFSIKKFVSGDETHAIEIMQLEDEIDKMEKKFQKKHVNRLANNKCEPHAAMIFSDLLSNLERVADHGVNIAFAEQDEEEV